MSLSAAAPSPDHTSVEIRNRLEINYSGGFRGAAQEWRKARWWRQGWREEGFRGGREQLVDPEFLPQVGVCWGVL